MIIHSFSCHPEHMRVREHEDCERSSEGPYWRIAVKWL